MLDSGQKTFLTPATLPPMTMGCTCSKSLKTTNCKLLTLRSAREEKNYGPGNHSVTLTIRLITYSLKQSGERVSLTVRHRVRCCMKRCCCFLFFSVLLFFIFRKFCHFSNIYKSGSFCTQQLECASRVIFPTFLTILTFGNVVILRILDAFGAFFFTEQLWWGPTVVFRTFLTFVVFDLKCQFCKGFSLCMVAKFGHFGKVVNL